MIKNMIKTDVEIHDSVALSFKSNPNRKSLETIISPTVIHYERYDIVNGPKKVTSFWFCELVSC